MELIQSSSPGFAKDPNTGAIINTNTGQYELALAERKRVKEVKQIQTDIERLNSAISDLRSAIKEIQENKCVQ